MKKIALILVFAMLLSLVCVPTFADDAAIKESASGFFYVEANGEQIALSAASADKFIQVDGLYFKDLNGNGTLDVYEDWRQDVDARVADLLSQMTLDEKAGALLFACVAGQNGSTVTDFNADIAGFGGGGSDASVKASASVVSLDHPALNAREPIVEYNGLTFQPTAYQIQDLYVNTFIAALTGTPKDQLDTFNLLQGYAEDTRLGIPATFSGDRSYNTCPTTRWALPMTPSCCMTWFPSMPRNPWPSATTRPSTATATRSAPGMATTLTSSLP